MDSVIVEPSVSPFAFVSALRAATFVFTVRMEGAVVFPPYPGSMWRGAFGHAFKKTVCIRNMAPCEACLIRQQCVYSRLFESPTALGGDYGLRGATNAPHPFVPQFPEWSQQELRAGETYRFSLTLIGESLPFLPYFILAIEAMGRLGLTSRHVPFTLLRVEDQEGSPVYEAGGALSERYALTDGNRFAMAVSERPISRIRLHFLSPTRMIPKDGSGRKSVVLLDDMRLLVSHLYTRLHTLATLYCGNRTPRDWRSVEPLLDGVRVARSDLRWFEWTRYSSRQKQGMDFTGFVGEIEYEGALTPLYPLLKAGEALHVGKGASFGLGWYRLHQDEEGAA